MKPMMRIALIISGLLIASQNIIAQGSMQAVSMNELSQEELQKMQEAMMMRKMLDEAIKDLIKNNKESIAWLLQNFVKEPEKSMEKVMQLTQGYFPVKGKAMLYALATDFGIKNKKDSDEFVKDSMHWLSQVVPSEFAKWIYYSSCAELKIK